MPQQMRGFWICDCCNAAFDRQDEAQYHEELCSSSRARGPLSHHLAAGAAAVDAKDEQLRPRFDFDSEPSSQEHHRFQAATHHPPLSVAAAMESLHHHQQPLASSPRHSPSHPTVANAVPEESRRYLLLDDQTAEHHNLAPPDALACRNLQLFQEQIPLDGIPDNQQQQQQQYNHRIGLVCRRCATLGATLSDSELSMPRSIASMADAVHSMAERHLQSCELLPSKERYAIQDAVRLRQTYQAEGGFHWQQEEGHRRALVDFLKLRCFQLRIINRYPENSGICFAEAEDPLHHHEHPLHSTQQHAASEHVDHGEIPMAHGASPHSEAPPAPIPAAAAMAHFLANTALPPAPYTAAPTPPEDPHIQARHAAQQPFSPPMYLSPEALAVRQAAMAALDPQHHPATVAALYRQSHAALPQAPLSLELPANFPFFQDPYEGDWLCKFCSHVHPQYRDLNYRWSVPERTPPPEDFIDHHLSKCRAYLEQQRQHMSDYLQEQRPHAGAPQSPYPYTHAPHDVASYSAAYHPPRSNPEISPMTPATIYAHPYDGPAMPPSGMHHLDPHGSYTHDQAGHGQAPVQGKRSPGKARPAARKAIHFLKEQDRFTRTPDDQNLVRREDKLLLTDFLYYLMKQLQVVRFSEGDRKTRGGKRENINVGFGGLQCIHCAGSQKSRKFYWSGVDRLANSFAEIPSHVFKCKDCPHAVKDALAALKEIHPEQMSRLPRGSQKVFFRRVWKRIHDDDPQTIPTDDGSPRPSTNTNHPSNPVSPVEDTKQSSPSGTSVSHGSEETPLLIERPTIETAKLLAESILHATILPLSPSSRVLLSIAEDRDFLSEQDCFIRQQVEVFCATLEDVEIAVEDSKFPIELGQVGLRCIHCSLAKHGPGASGNAVVFPYSINGIYEAVREFERVHLVNCANFPLSWKAKLDNMNESSTISSIQRKYYTLAAKGLGLKDFRGGIRAGSESVPVVSQAVFSLSETDATEDWKEEQNIGEIFAAGSAAKRKHYRLDDEGDEPDSKRSHWNHTAG
jgi:hypothetical protein